MQPCWWILSYSGRIFFFLPLVTFFVLFTWALEFIRWVVLYFSSSGPSSSLNADIKAAHVMNFCPVTITWLLWVIWCLFDLRILLFFTLLHILVSRETLPPQIYMKHYQIADPDNGKKVDETHDENLWDVKIQKTCGKRRIVQRVSQTSQEVSFFRIRFLEKTIDENHLKCKFEFELEGWGHDSSEKKFVIFWSNTVVEKFAMMIETLSTSITLRAVFACF